MRDLAFLFPGQGAQAVGMGLDLHRSQAAAREVFAEADETLGFPLSRLCFEGPEDELKLTENAQPAILTVSIAAYRALMAGGASAPAYLAGHSLGEYSALVAAESLSFAEAVFLVRRRGQLMAEAAVSGTESMAAVIGLDEGAVGEIVHAAQASGVVEVANLNCPGQIVVAGEKPALDEAGRLAKEAGAKGFIPLSVSGAFHSSLMRPAAEKFARELARIKLRPAVIPVVANVLAGPVSDPAEIGRLLVEQIYSPVRWEESMRFLLQSGVGSFIELGPGKVLSGLLKRIDRAVRTMNVRDEAGLKETLAFFGEV